MENHGDIRRDRKTSRWDVFASRWKGNGNSSILRKPSSTVGDISRKIAVLPYTGWDLKNFKDIPKTNWRWGFFNQKRSRTKRKSGSTRSKWFESMWVCKWNFRNSEATETALQCNQVSVQVLFAISRCDHLQNKPVGGEDAKMQTSEMRLILGIGCIRGHSSCSIGVCSTDPVALGRWYSLILETFDICPIVKLKWIYTYLHWLQCTYMYFTCYAEPMFRRMT